MRSISGSQNEGKKNLRQERVRTSKEAIVARAKSVGAGREVPGSDSARLAMGNILSSPSLYLQYGLSVIYVR